MTAGIGGAKRGRSVFGNAVPAAGTSRAEVIIRVAARSASLAIGARAGMSEQKPSIIQNIGKALEVLCCFTRSEPELGISEVAAKLNMYKSTTYRILKTMEHYGFVVQGIDNQKYRLGFKLFDLGTVVISGLEVRDVALPFMRSLCEKTNETVALNIMDGNDRVCIEKVDSSQSLRNVIPIGFRNPIYLAAAGKVLLAYSSNDIIHKIIYHNELINTMSGKIIDPDKLYIELQEIRDRGYTFSNKEVSNDSSAVAAPIRNHTNTVVASLSIHGPEHRFTDERKRYFLNELIATAHNISVRSGWTKTDDSTTCE